MSHSYKKNPVVKDSYASSSKKYAKKAANHKVRAMVKHDYDLLISGNNYKKLSESWNINDYISRWTKEDAINYYNRNSNVSTCEYKYNPEEFVEKFLTDYPTVDDFLVEWKKEYLSK